MKRMTVGIFEFFLSLKIMFLVKKKEVEKKAFRAKLFTNEMLRKNDRNDSRLLRVTVENSSAAAAVNLSHRQAIFKINIVLA